MIVQIDKMSSKQVAELMGKLHKHVIRDIKNMLTELFEDGPDLDHERYQTLTDDRGYTSPKLEILP